MRELPKNPIFADPKYLNSVKQKLIRILTNSLIRIYPQLLIELINHIQIQKCNILIQAEPFQGLNIINLFIDIVKNCNDLLKQNQNYHILEFLHQISVIIIESNSQIKNIVINESHKIIARQILSTMQENTESIYPYIDYVVLKKLIYYIFDFKSYDKSK